MKLRVAAVQDEVYLLDNAGETQRATYPVFDFLELQLFAGEFQFCDEVLEQADVARLSTSVMRAFLTVTAPARSKLASRPAFYARVHAAILHARGVETTQRLIGALS